MALIRIPEEKRTIRNRDAVAERLATAGIDYEVWAPSHPLEPDATSVDILDAYPAEIDRLKNAGGYVTAGVIDVNAQTPNLDAILADFSREHWHDDDQDSSGWSPHYTESVVDSRFQPVCVGAV